MLSLRGEVCDTYRYTAIWMSIKICYIGDYSSTQVLRVSTQVLRYSRVNLGLSISLSSHRRHHTESTQKIEVSTLANTLAVFKMPQLCIVPCDLSSNGSN